jgi:hypothetical protein
MVVQQNFIIAYLRGKNVCLQHSLKGTAGLEKKLKGQKKPLREKEVKTLRGTSKGGR